MMMFSLCRCYFKGNPDHKRTLRNKLNAMVILLYLLYNLLPSLLWNKRPCLSGFEVVKGNIDSDKCYIAIKNQTSKYFKHHESLITMYIYLALFFIIDK